MVPFITKGGKSFRRAWLYFCHDKRASTTERVGWIEFRNLLTDCPKKAWRLMEYTYRSRRRLKQSAGRCSGGRDVLKPCYSYSLSWHPDEQPSQEEMIELADESLRVLGLEEHQAMIVHHTDEPHPHLHIIVNRIHPETGVAVSPSYSKRKLSDLALRYEKEQGVVRCPAREHQARQGEQEIESTCFGQFISNAWSRSASPGEFISLLEAEGYRISMDGRRLVVVDQAGKVMNPVRHLEGVGTKEFLLAMKPYLDARYSPRI